MSSVKENHHDHDKHHIVLVHGACHGAWSWYKVKPRLEAEGHRVTALDLAASGTNQKAIQDVYSMKDYSQPLLELMEALGPNDQKVVLVGHSLGGLSLALAMDMFPEKIAAAVFVTAFMPDTIHRPSYVLDQYCERIPSDSWLDTKFGTYQTPNGPITSMFFGPKFFSSKLYQLSPSEDLELANTLARPGSLFIEDLYKANKFSDEGFGSVPRVYVVCDEDKAIPVEFQRWMIGNNDVSDTVEICGADHMPMFSKPQELCDSLVKIAHSYT